MQPYPVFTEVSCPVRILHFCTFGALALVLPLETLCCLQAIIRWGGALLELAHFRQGEEAYEMIEQAGFRDTPLQLTGPCLAASFLQY